MTLCVSQGKLSKVGMTVSELDCILVVSLKLGSIRFLFLPLYGLVGCYVYPYKVSVVVGDGVICKPRLRHGPYKGDRMIFFVILAGINHFVIIFRWCCTTYPTEEIKSHDFRVD